MGWSPTFWTMGNGILTNHVTTGAAEENKKEEQEEAEAGATGIKREELGRSAVATASGRCRVMATRTAQRILSPPIVACMAGLAVGLLPPLQWLFMGPRAPLAPLWSALENLTTAYTPAGVLVLAGSLANCPKGKVFTKETCRTITSVAIARWLLMPIFTAGLLLLGVRTRVVPRDPMLLFVLLMQSAMPSAQNSVIQLQV
ncbi:unnamed protein product, partial [Discosporangium mesarthrocarpum]